MHYNFHQPSENPPCFLITTATLPSFMLQIKAPHIGGKATVMQVLEQDNQNKTEEMKANIKNVHIL